MRRDGEMLPGAREVHESQVDGFDFFFTDERQDFFRRHSKYSYRCEERRGACLQLICWRGVFQRRTRQITLVASDKWLVASGEGWLGYCWNTDLCHLDANH